ncbi:hypothetical protein C6558_13115 [Ensifer sp. NM-2]|jgi:hypothetical protein|nr:hypothetical protein ASD03_27310 [Ensifer sp. Root127]PSS64443.1 hypothetical protein C6558_13115 [Ensifer sp. NM-2]
MMRGDNTSHQNSKLVGPWSDRYDLEEFIAAYHLTPLAAREIFVKFGPQKAELDRKMKELGVPTNSGH